MNKSNKQFILWMAAKELTKDLITQYPIFQKAYNDIKRSTLNKRQRLKVIAMRKGRR